MYNLDMNSTSGTMTLLTLDPGCNTPRTPEILNTVLNMQNPLDGFISGVDVKPPIKTSSLATRSLPLSASAMTSGTVTTATINTAAYYNHSDSSNSSSCASQHEPPSMPSGMSSVQRNRTELIKASLKLTIEQKRKQQSDQDDCLLDLDQYRKRVKKSECSESEEDKMLTVGLTEEDEERRKRRRERNKIAATKCRLKKRERTANLMTESDAMEQQNVDLKTQIDQLRKEQYKLEQVMDAHRRQCVMNIPPATIEKLVAVSNGSNGVNRRLSGMDSPLSSSRSANHHHQHLQSYSNNSSPSSVTPVSTLSPNNNRPASADLTSNTYLHSTLELYTSPITGGDCHLQQARPSSVGGILFHNGHQQVHNHHHHQQLQQQQQHYSNIVRAPSITIIDDCINDGAYTPHLTDMDQPNGQYDDYEYHNYMGDGASSQNMFSLMA